MRKKRVLIHSNFCEMFTGFGKHKKNLLSYLYATGKYEIIEFSNGYRWSDENIKFTPWDNYGSLPDDPELLKEIEKDQARMAGAGYGAEMIDDAIYKLKPDIYLGVEDIWGFNGYFDKPWWNKIHCIIHTTLDSLPLLPDAVAVADKIKYYYVWASFAEKALHQAGHTHVKTVHGTLDTKSFYRIEDNQRSQLKRRFGLQDSFVIGFVFRNQLRKSVPNLLDGFKIFCEKVPNSNAKLLLHTHWSEGWDIPRLINEKGLDGARILTTYFCKNCSEYHVRPFGGQNIGCPHCGCGNSCETTNIKTGVNESQLNEVYNLMDVYCHPFTSGGQEIPIQEAKLTELVTLATHYSCGEDANTPESGGLPLEWAEYREPGTQFIKASTLPEDIARKLQKVYEMPQNERRTLEKQARQYVINNYSIEKVGKIFEDLFDSLPLVDFDLKREEILDNPFFVPNETLQDKEWVESLYDNILHKKDIAGVHHWINRLKTDLKRHDVLAYFKKVAFSQNQRYYLTQLLEELKQSPNQKRLAIVQPEKEEEVLNCVATLSSLREKYPDYQIYFFTKSEYFDLVNSNPYVHKVLPFHPKMMNPLYLEGRGDEKKYFDIAFLPFLSLHNNYLHNNQDIQ